MMFTIMPISVNSEAGNSLSNKVNTVSDKSICCLGFVLAFFTPSRQNRK